MFDFGRLYRLEDAETFSISAENPTGERDRGALEIPGPDNPARRLGKGWKVRPCINLKARQETLLADIEGPGVITYMWITVTEKAYRTCVLRMYWDDETNPSVEVPLGDFFVNPFGMRFEVNSLPVCVNPTGGFNCYWPMPFRKRARITIENQADQDIMHFFYQISFVRKKLEEDVAYLHSQWRRSMTSRENPQHVILDSVEGKGKYVGTVVAWEQLSNGWWGEGEVRFFIDGEQNPSICYTGTEDYFGGAWCFGKTYSTAFTGYPLWLKTEGQIPKHVMYRWHIADPIFFKKSLKVIIQALGWWPDGTYQPLTDDITTVAYWYQTEPHVPFPKLLNLEKRWPR